MDVMVNGKIANKRAALNMKKVDKAIEAATKYLNAKNVAFEFLNDGSQLWVYWSE